MASPLHVATSSSLLLALLAGCNDGGTAVTETAGAAGTTTETTGTTTGTSATSTATTSASTGTGDDPTGGDGSSGSTGGGVDPSACSPDALDEPFAGVTYYLAVNDPGADNDACDGLAPTDEGGGHCPFKDFTSTATRALLDGKKSVRVALRKGTYVVYGWDGIRVTGIGTSEAERVILTSYRGEEVVLDTAAPDGAPCMGDAPDTVPECVRETVRISGHYTLVQGLTVQNGLGYHIEISGGDHHLVRCNRVQETVVFPGRSDALKLDGGANAVTIQNNEFLRWRSQAIDLTGVHDVLIEANDFHDPLDADGGAVGMKFGTADVTIRDNTIHDLGSSTAAHVFSLGGTGSPHPDDAQAYRLTVTGNRISNVKGILGQFVSCQNCAFEGNDASDVGAGLLLSAASTASPECSASPDGCKPTTDARITGNRMRNFLGGGDPDGANIFIAIESGEATGFTAGDNLYCAPSESDPRFFLFDTYFPFAEWTAASGTDASSSPAAATDPRCAGW